MLAKYGDESGYHLLWELFAEGEAKAAIEAARKCMRINCEMAEAVK